MNISLSDHFGYKKLIQFTLPTIAMMIFSSIYGIVDGLFISNIVGAEAFAAVNLIMPVTMILGSFGFMFGTGGSALVAKTLGENKKKKANEIFSMLMVVLAVLGVVLAIIGRIVLRPMAGVLGATEEMLPVCITYASILMLALPFFMIQNSFQSFLVVAEKPRMGLMISIISGVTNMILDFLFIYVFRLGVAGAAFATGISQVVGAIVPIIYFLRPNDSPLKLIRPSFDIKMLIQSAANGSSEMVTNIANSLISMLYNWQLMRIAGSDGVVAYGVIMYAGFIFTGTYLGYSIGSAPIVGYNYGAKNTTELKNVLKRSLILLGAAAVILTSIAELTAGIQARMFASGDEELIRFTIHAIRLYSLSHLLSAFNIYASSFFTALNNGFISAVLSFLRTFVFLVAAILAAPIVLGVDGIWLAVVFAEVLGLILSISFILANKKKYGY